jgi:hypothetical protein
VAASLEGVNGSAFLVPWYHAANTDFLHHAADRLIVRGDYSFGKGPFTWAAEKH